MVTVPTNPRMRKLGKTMTGAIVVLAAGAAMVGCAKEIPVSTTLRLSDMVKLVITDVRELEDTSPAPGNVEIKVTVVNICNDELQLFFLGRKYESAGSFRIVHDGREYVASERLSGHGAYDVMPAGWGILPPGAATDFDLCFEIEQARVQKLLANPTELSLVMYVMGIEWEGKYTELTGDATRLEGQWK